MRRFLELGNEFIKLGHRFTVFLPPEEVSSVLWKFEGEFGDWEDIDVDILLCGDVTNLGSIGALNKAKATHKLVYVIIGNPVFLRHYEDLARKYPMILNNRIFRPWFKNAYQIEGGISDFWKPKKLRVAYHGNKGGLVAEQLGELKHIELVPLKGLTDEELREEYYKADYFVSAETREGWGNMMAEALACGTPVIATGRNFEPFEEYVIKVDNLKDYFDDPMKKFRYAENAKKILKIVETL